MATDKKVSDLMIIESFYIVVLDLLQHNKKSEALKILHEAMPSDLYDKSLDIWENRNDDIANKSLRKLIKKVDKILNPTLIADEMDSDKPIDNSWYEPEED